MPAMLAAGAISKNVIEYGGTTAVHTLRHRSIGNRPPVNSDGGPDLHRGASVRYGHGRTDHGRYCFAGRGRQEGGADSDTENGAFRLLRPFLEIRAFEFTGTCRRGDGYPAAAKAGRAVGFDRQSATDSTGQCAAATTVDIAVACLPASGARSFHQIPRDAGLPPDLPQAKSGDFDAPASKTADIASSLIAEFRRHLKACSKLPGSIALSDKVKVTLRVLMMPEGKLAAEPILIEASASTKGPALMQGAITALQACQPYAMLPADRYGEWKVLDLSFTPQDFSGAS